MSRTGEEGEDKGPRVSTSSTVIIWSIFGLPKLYAESVFVVEEAKRDINDHVRGDRGFFPNAVY